MRKHLLGRTDNSDISFFVRHHAPNRLETYNCNEVNIYNTSLLTPVKCKYSSEGANNFTSVQYLSKPHFHFPSPLITQEEDDAGQTKLLFRSFLVSEVILFERRAGVVKRIRLLGTAKSQNQAPWFLNCRVGRGGGVKAR